jgi:hypothetical protein
MARTYPLSCPQPLRVLGCFCVRSLTRSAGHADDEPEDEASLRPQPQNEAIYSDKAVANLIASVPAWECLPRCY